MWWRRMALKKQEDLVQPQSTWNKYVVVHHKKKYMGTLP